MKKISNVEKIVSILVPCFNEAEVIKLTHKRIIGAVNSIDGFTFELIYIDDGSVDNTLDLLGELPETDKVSVRVISFTRNFGHQQAIAAGLKLCNGNCAVILDADLQDPPELIPKLLGHWVNGYEVVYGVRKKRKESILKRTSYYVFYRIYRYLAEVEVPVDSGDFCLMDRVVIDFINSLQEKNKFLRGLRSWGGFKQFGMEYERDRRFAGETKYSFIKLLNLAKDGIFNFSVAPLRIISTLGVVSSITSLVFLVVFALQRAYGFKIFSLAPADVPGWTSLVMIMTMLGGVQLLSLGIIGEYIGRLYVEVKARPEFIIKK